MAEVMRVFRTGARVDGIEVKLSSEERREILLRCSVPKDLQELLDDRNSVIRPIRLTPKQVDLLRTAVADRLQAAGFDENWAVNEEGKLLEGIIDKLIPRAKA